MLGEILFVLLVLAVAVLMAVDLVRTRGESVHGHADTQAHGAERVVAASPSRDFAARAFSLEPARAMPTFPAAAASLPPRETEATRAFDQMHQEMSRSAANEAEFRERLNAIFVNLSHRSQSLVERQLRLIDDLERGEQDPQRRAKLSKLNRIAMHMHRNAQNLLVMAGDQASPNWNQPVTLAHLVNAAVAEVEDSERISAEVQPDIAVRGPAVNDLVHLLVELIENATSFSAAEMPVQIKGHILTSGGALVDITDRGIGMTAKEMAYVNQQLDNPPATDTDIPKWMGLLVVARLAARHGIRVRLNQAASGGLTALVWLPDEILTHYSAADPGRAAAKQRGAAVSAAALASARMNTQDVPAARPESAWSAPSPQATLQAELPATDQLPGSGDTDVVVSYGENHARTRGLPIFDEVESRWSRDSREAPGPVGLATAPGSAAGGPAGALPRRPSPATQGTHTVPGMPSGAPGRQGRAVPAEEGNPGGPNES
jgi:signal transduction histidine kinase